MTENMKIAMEAINKFMFFSWNYDHENHEWEQPNGELKDGLVPTFLKQIKWTCHFNHMYEKWLAVVTGNNNPYSYLSKFYSHLDTDNRKLLLEWVLTNYNNEHKL